MDLNGTATLKNVKTAFARTSSSSVLYSYFAQKADVEGRTDDAIAFRAAAETLKASAHGLLEFMEDFGDPVSEEPIGTAAKNLDAALAGEVRDAKEVYPKMASVARQEKMHGIAEWFDTLTQARKRLADAFRDRLTQGKTDKAEDA